MMTIGKACWRGVRVAVLLAAMMWLPAAIAGAPGEKGACATGAAMAASACGKCGDGRCTPQCGETSASCPKDCGVADTSSKLACGKCGDGRCTPQCGETSTSCPKDCGVTSSGVLASRLD